MEKQYSINDLFKSSWSELTVKERAQLIELRDKMVEANKQRLIKSYGFFCIGILRLLRKDKKAVSKIDVQQAVDCINDLTFINKPWFDFIDVKPGYLKKPDDYFTNITYAQFAHADRCFSKFLIEAYNKRDGIEYINLLCACLYVTPFKETELEDHAAEIREQLSIAERSVIFYTYANIREFLVNKYPALFPKPPVVEDDDKQEPKKVKPVDTGPMWQNLWYDLAETPVFQGFENAGKANVYIALDYLEKKQIEILNQKQAHAKV